MSDKFTDLKDVEFKEVKYIKIHADGPAETHPYKYNVMLPRPLADWDVFDYWEKERTDCMDKTLEKGDVLFDIGAENGWLSAIYAQFVGAENMVLMEPTPEYWPNIKAVWKMNGLANPKACWSGLISNENKGFSASGHKKGSKVEFGWPDDSNTDSLMEVMRYRYIHEHGHMTPQITIDKFVELSGVVPAALTMDTEGAELFILQGAVKTLKKSKPVVFVSIHPELAVKAGYGDTQQIHDLMQSLGYSSHFLATDHEDHWVFWHPDGKLAKW